MTSTTTIHKGQPVTVELTEKAKAFNEIAIHGTKWFGSSNNTTYHIAYLTARIGDQWIELGNTGINTGFGDHYLVSAGEWLIANGYMVAPDGYVLGGWPVRDALGITYTSEEVKRKKDL